MLIVFARCDLNKEMTERIFRSEGEKTLTFTKYYIMDLSVLNGATLTLQSPQAVEIQRILQNEGAYFDIHRPSRKSYFDDITESHYKASAFFSNVGLFAYDCPYAAIAHRVHIGHTIQFRNLGKMWFCLGGNQRIFTEESLSMYAEFSSDPDLTVTASEELYNAGQIILKGHLKHKLLARMEVTAHHCIQNEGLIILINAFLEIRSGVSGKGCIAILGKSVLVLANPQQHSSEQSIVMRAGHASAVLELWVGDALPRFDITVEGFNVRNIIRFSAPMKLSPDSTNGMFHFVSYNGRCEGFIKLRYYTSSDIQFDGTTLRSLEKVRPARPTNCNLKFGDTERKIVKARDAI